MVGFLVMCGGFYFGLEQLWQIVLISLLFGLTNSVTSSFFVVYGAQVAFPADQASVAGYLTSISQVVGFVFGLALLPFVEQTRANSMVLFLVIGGCMLLGALLTFTIKEDLRKDRY